MHRAFYLVILATLISFESLADTPSPLLTPEERAKYFGQWTFRNGIWEDQWDFYSPNWQQQEQNVDESEVPDNWVSFRDDNSGGGNGTSALFNSYRNFVNHQVNDFNASAPSSPSVPIDGGLGILLIGGIGFGASRLRKISKN